MRKTTARVHANPQEAAANREAFRRLSDAYASRKVYGIPEMESLGRTAVPNALSGTFVGGQEGNVPADTLTKTQLAVESGVDLKAVQDRHRLEVLPAMGIELA